MDLICTKYKPVNRDSLLGYFDITFVDTGMQIFGCSLFMKNGKRWINFPSKEYTNANGERKYTGHIRYNTIDMFNKFQSAAIKAVEDFCNQQQKEESKQVIDDDCPF